MRDLNIDCLILRSSIGEWTPAWLQHADLANLAPGVHLIRERCLPRLAANLEAGRLLDCGEKNPNNGLKTRLLSARARAHRGDMLLVRGAYRTSNQAVRSMHDFMANAETAGAERIFLVAVSDALFASIWRAHAAAKPKARTGASGAGEASAPRLPEAYVESEHVVFEQRYQGRDAKVRGVRHMIVRASRTREPVLLVGEPGVGKNSLAHALHELSGSGGFVAVDCLAIDDTKPDHALFVPAGKAAAKGGATHQLNAVGTLYLEEIAALPRRHQGILRGAIRQARDQKSARIVMSTTRDLEAEVKAGRFDAALLYDVSRIVIHVPPLRACVQDIPALAQAMWKKVTGNDRARLSDAVIKRLSEQRWPGNVRDLKSFLTMLLNMFNTEKPGLEQVDMLLDHQGRARIHAPASRLDRLTLTRRMRDVIRNAGDLARRPAARNEEAWTWLALELEALMELMNEDDDAELRRHARRLLDLVRLAPDTPAQRTRRRDLASTIRNIQRTLPPKS